MNSNNYKIFVIGGWCGNLLFIVADHLRNVIMSAGYSVQLKTHSVWENYTQPPSCQLILQLLPAFSEEEVDCPVINIRRLLVERDHAETIQKVLSQIASDHQS